jgi:hypothetical protein
MAKPPRIIQFAVLANVTIALISAQASPSDLLQLHIAEYNALTTRNTYLMTLQFSLLPVILVVCVTQIAH